MTEATAPAFPFDDVLRLDRLPHIWCAGCGLGIILQAFGQALQAADIHRDHLVVVSGIGCAGRASGYVNCDAFHTTHGRALAFATGVKVANPTLKVVVFSGDGDLFAIGGNHFIHAARRNVEMLVICANNFNYGMTGGQVGPTTPLEARTTTTPAGNWEEPFNLVQLAAAAGATYVARWAVVFPQQLTQAIAKGLRHEGFGLVEVISACPSVYGSLNGLADPWEVMMRLRLVCRRGGIGLTPADAVCDPAERIVCGEFLHTQRPGYTARLAELRAALVPVTTPELNLSRA